MKRWSYRQLTDATERQIAEYHRGALKTASERPGDRFYQDLYHGWAYGAYALWRDVTMGWQEDGAGDRLQALAEAVGREPVGALTKGAA